MIKPVCDLKLSKNCEGELKQFGAILFSPPKGKTCIKYHVCKQCFDLLMQVKDSAEARRRFHEYKHFSLEEKVKER